MAQNERPGIDPKVMKLHEALIAATGGPPSGGEPENPYWTVGATDFETFFQSVLGESGDGGGNGDEDSPGNSAAVHERAVG
jgi:hypothetical protein